MTRQGSFLIRLWRVLTDPSERVSDPEERRRARALAGIVVVILPVAMVVGFLVPLFEQPGVAPWRNPDIVRSQSIIVISAIPYWMSRTRFHHWGSLLLVALAIMGTIAPFMINPTEAGARSGPFYMTTGVVVAAILLPMRETLGVAVLEITALVVFAAITPEVSTNDLAAPVGLLVLISVILIAGVAIREAEVKDRRKAQDQIIALEDRLRQQQKLESIGTLASGAAHEINNPVHAILNYAQVIRDNSENSQMGEFAGIIASEAGRISGIVRNLLVFARQERTGEMAMEDVREILEESLTVLRPVLKQDHITLELDLEEDLPEVGCTRHEIQQVVMNLLTNARDAVNERHPQPHDEKVVRVQIRNGGNRLLFSVEDHGLGIPPDVESQIFDPFFTTKPRDRGTGLGLSISYSIVADHGGELKISSTGSEGTTFTMELPVESDHGSQNA